MDYIRLGNTWVAVDAVERLLRSLAARGEDQELRAMLAERPDLVDARCPDTGTTALMEAARGGSLGCLQALLSAGASPDATSDGGCSALELAIERGHLGIAQTLLAAGASPDSGVAIHLAAEREDMAALGALLAAGADVNRPTCAPQHNPSLPEGTRPLHAAAHKRGSMQAAYALLAAGADIDACDGMQRSALLAACHIYSKPSMLQLLIDAGADPNAADSAGNTPLHEFAIHGTLRGPACVKALVLAGAALDSYNHAGLTPLECASKYVMGQDGGFVKVVLEALDARRKLVDSVGGWAGGPPLHRAAALGQLGCLRVLLRQPGADPDAAWKGSTPLLVAAQLGREGCLSELLAGGAAVEAADAEGCTAVSLAAANGYWSCLRALLAADAAFDAAGHEGWAPLHAAAAAGHEDCVIALLEAGADPRAAGPQGCTALELAAEAGHEACVWTLLMEGARPADASYEIIAEAMHALGLDADCIGPDETGQSAATPGSGGAGSDGGAGVLDEALQHEVVCPITHVVMDDPVLAADGTTYERLAIQAWIARQQAEGREPTSPATNLPLEHLQLTDNRLARALIASLRAAGLIS